MKYCDEPEALMPEEVRHTVGGCQAEFKIGLTHLSHCVR
jgi:hypothetical protein